MIAINLAEDLVRPSKIKDFFIKSIDLTNKLVNFTFTAPGDDGELGSGKRQLLSQFACLHICCFNYAC